MSVVHVPHSGSRGATMSRMPGPLAGLGQFFSDTIFRLYRNRRFMGMRLVNLTTIGAKSGKTRHTTLAYFEDPADSGAWIIVGSAAGAARNPAWLHNLAAHPDRVWLEIGTRKVQVRPETLAGAERAEAWRRVIAESPNYAAYEEKTDREIPLVRLKPVGGLDR